RSFGAQVERDRSALQKGPCGNGQADVDAGELSEGPDTLLPEEWAFVFSSGVGIYRRRSCRVAHWPYPHNSNRTLRITIPTTAQTTSRTGKLSRIDSFWLPSSSNRIRRSRSSSKSSVVIILLIPLSLSPGHSVSLLDQVRLVR